jgi:hypothetical protein
MRKLKVITLLTIKAILGMNLVHAEGWIKPAGSSAFKHDQMLVSQAFGNRNAAVILATLFNKISPHEATDMIALAKEVRAAKESLKKLEQKFTDLADDTSKAQYSAMKKALEEKLAVKKQAFFSRMSTVRAKIGQRGVYNKLFVFKRSSAAAESADVKTGFFKTKGGRNVILILAGVGILAFDAVQTMDKLDELPEVEREVENLINIEESMEN